MGAVHSRKTGPAKIDKESLVDISSQQINIQLPFVQFRFRVNPMAPSKGGYFILSIKSDKVKVVNADSAEISLLTSIIRRHTRILSEGWERHMTWTIQLGNYRNYVFI